MNSNESFLNFSKLFPTYQCKITLNIFQMLAQISLTSDAHSFRWDSTSLHRSANNNNIYIVNFHWLQGFFYDFEQVLPT